MTERNFVDLLSPQMVNAAGDHQGFIGGFRRKSGGLGSRSGRPASDVGCLSRNSAQSVFQRSEADLVHARACLLKWWQAGLSQVMCVLFRSISQSLATNESFESGPVPDL